MTNVMISPARNHWGFSKRLASTSQLANKAIARIAEKVMALTIHVEPKSKEKVVTLFVSIRRNPAPKKKKTGSHLPIFIGVRMNTMAKEIPTMTTRVFI